MKSADATESLLISCLTTVYILRYEINTPANSKKTSHSRVSLANLCEKKQFLYIRAQVTCSKLEERIHELQCTLHRV